MLATTSRSETTSTASVLQTGFAISRKTTHSSRVRWPDQPLQRNTKEKCCEPSEIYYQLSIDRFLRQRRGARFRTHGAVSLAGHHSDPRQGEIHNPDRTADDRKDHGSRHWRQGLLDCGRGWQLLLCASGEARHQLKLEPHHRQGEHLQFHT